VTAGRRRGDHLPRHHRAQGLRDELHQHACYDSLTGLANRRLLVERLDQALRRSVLDRKTHALIFVDVEPLQEHQRQPRSRDGDGFSSSRSGPLKAGVRSNDLLARFGGDEFVVLLEDVTGVAWPSPPARRICAAVQQPIVLTDGHETGRQRFGGIALTEPGKSG